MRLAILCTIVGKMIKWDNQKKNFYAMIKSKSKQFFIEGFSSIINLKHSLKFRIILKDDFGSILGYNSPKDMKQT